MLKRLFAADDSEAGLGLAAIAAAALLWASGAAVASDLFDSRVSPPGAHRSQSARRRHREAGAWLGQTLSVLQVAVGLLILFSVVWLQLRTREPIVAPEL